VDDLIQAVVKSYGIIGLFMIAPVLSTIWLWRDNVRLNNDARQMAKDFAATVDEVGKRVVLAQEKRVDDSQSISNKLVDMVSEHAAASKETTLALDRIGDMISMLNIQFNGVQPSPRRDRGDR
jgi:hypothetical protein